MTFIINVNKFSLENSSLPTYLDLNYKLPTDQTHNYLKQEAIKTQYRNSIPLPKLNYPEPFITSPSFIHTDIGFINLGQIIKNR